MPTVLFTEVELCCRQGFTRRSCTVMWAAGDRCVCQLVALPQCCSGPATWSGEMLSPVCYTRCSHLPAAAYLFQAEECVEFNLTCQCQASDTKSHVRLDRSPDLEWCQWLVWSSVILIASYQKLDVGRQTDGWSLTVSRSCEIAGASKSLKVALTFIMLVLFPTSSCFYATNTLCLTFNPACVWISHIIYVRWNSVKVILPFHTHLARFWLWLPFKHSYIGCCWGRWAADYSTWICVHISQFVRRYVCLTTLSSLTPPPVAVLIPMCS